MVLTEREKTGFGIRLLRNIKQSVEGMGSGAADERKTIKLRELSTNLVKEFNQEKIGEINFVYNIFDEVEKKQLIDQAASLKKEKTVVCFLNKLGDNAQIVLVVSEDLGIKANELLKGVMEKFNGRGGGRENFAMGSIKADFSEKALETLKELIKSS